MGRIEPEAHAVDGFQVDLWVGFKIFSQFGDEHIHAPAQEIVVLAPNVQQDFFSFQDTIGMFAKKFQEVGFFLGEVEDIGADGEFEIGIREIELANGEANGLFGVHLARSPKENFHSHQELLYAEGLGDIVIRPALEALYLVFFHGPGREKEDRYHIALLPDLLGHCEPVLIRHHDIQQTDGEFVLIEFLDGRLAVGTQDYFIPCVNQIILDDIAKRKIVFRQ